MKEISVISLGTGKMGDVTGRQLCLMRDVAYTYVCRGMPQVEEYLTECGFAYSVYENDYLNDAYIDEEAKKVLDTAKVNSVLIITFEAVHDAFIRAVQKETEVSFFGGEDFSFSCIKKAGVVSGFSVRRADDTSAIHDNHLHVITCLYKHSVACAAKHHLMKYFDEDTDILFFKAGEEKCSKIALSAIDKQTGYGQNCCVLLLPKEGFFKARYSIEDLLKLMRFLRSEKGCPWDRKQTHESLRPYLIEEAYEAAIAIDSDEALQMVDEFGDVLLQLALHSIIGEEKRSFAWTDIVSAISKKMVERHRHVFGKDVCATADEVAENWNKIKSKERHISTLYGEMQSVAKGLPPLLRAEKIQKKASKVGYDFESAQAALKKVMEEANELLVEMEKNGEIAMEYGDLLFASVNVGRLLGVDGEKALNRSIEKFINRIKWIEDKIISDGKAWKCLTNEEMSVYWNSSKVDEI